MSCELDIKIAGLLGWTHIERFGQTVKGIHPQSGMGQEIPYYSTSLDTAWGLKPKGWELSVHSYVTVLGDYAEAVLFTRDAVHTGMAPGHTAASAATAICEAFVGYMESER